MTNNNDNNGSNTQSFDYDFLVEDSLKNVVNKMVYKTGKPRNIVYKEALKINLVKK